jgi:hypothetical protein
MIFGLVSFACGGLRFDSPVVSDPASQENMAASNVTRWFRSETRVWIGNKQARTFLQPQMHRKERQVVEDQEGRACGQERGLRGTKPGTMERAACPIHISDEDAPAQIQIQDLAEIPRSSKGAL